MNKGILLVEDNSDDAALAVRIIQMHSAHKVMVVRDGAEALDFLFGTEGYESRDFTIPPYLILLDLRLPKISGLDVLRRIKNEERTRCCPVIVLSASTEERDIKDCYALGANSYIHKQIDYSQFKEDIKLMLTYWFGINLFPLDK